MRKEINWKILFSLFCFNIINIISKKGRLKIVGNFGRFRKRMCSIPTGLQALISTAIQCRGGPYPYTAHPLRTLAFLGMAEQNQPTGNSYQNFFLNFNDCLSADTHFRSCTEIIENHFPVSSSSKRLSPERFVD